MLPSLPPPLKKRKTSLLPQFRSVHLDPRQCAAKLTLDADTYLTVAGKDGYRTVRGNAFVEAGTWYYECKVNAGVGHMRIGYSTQKHDLNTPVGSDQNGYALRDSRGDLFHQAKAIPYPEAAVDSCFGPGDVIGCLIHLPELDEAVLKQRALAQVSTPATPAAENVTAPSDPSSTNPASAPLPTQPQYELLPESGITFYKNGVNLGVAFSPIYEGKYFPAISLFKSACVDFNPGPEFDFPPQDVAPDFNPFSEAQIVQQFFD